MNRRILRVLWHSLRTIISITVGFALVVVQTPIAAARVEDRGNYKYLTLPTPVLVAPAGAVAEENPGFAWNDVAGASTYEFCVQTAEGGSVFRRDGVRETTFRIPGECRFTSGSTYRFTVRAYDLPTHRASAYAPWLYFAPTASQTNLPPIARLSADPTSGPDPLVVRLDASASLDPEGGELAFVWDFTADGTTDAVGATATATYPDPGSFEVRLTVTDPLGASSIATAAILVEPRVPQVTLSAEPTRVLAGQSVTLSWEATHATSVVLEPGLGEQPSRGSTLVVPASDTTYTATATGAGGQAVAEVFVDVNHRPQAVASALPTSSVVPFEVALSAAGSQDPDGEEVTCGWDLDADGVADLNSSEATWCVSAPGTQSAQLIVTDSEGASATAAVNVVGLYPAPQAYLTLSPERVFEGGSALLSWTATAVTSVEITPGIGPVPPSGAQLLTPLSDTTYTILATGPGGTTSSSVRLDYVPVAAPPQGGLADRYSDLIPNDATLDHYEARRFSVLVGNVADAEGDPVSGVRVDVADRPEYGSAATDASGTFALPTDGGGFVTLDLSAPGYLPLQRQVQVGFGEITRVDDVRITPVDAASTVVLMGSRLTSVAVHTGSTTSNDAGIRAASVVFQPGTRAYAVDEHGNETELRQITVRATEFTTPSAMPAQLPAASQFTYCVDLGADEAQDVRFDTTVTVLVDDFIGFPVGTSVPVGYYDYDSTRWVPSRDGVIVRVIGTRDVPTGLDSTGDGVADDLDGDGQTADEVEGLDGSRFSVGKTFMRVSVTHFSPWDFNWALIQAAIHNMFPSIPYSDEKGICWDCLFFGGSAVSRDSRVLAEEIDLPGTGMSLHYSSDEVPGRASVVEIPAVGRITPVGATAVNVRMDVAGVTFTRRLLPEANQAVTFTWDGKDFTGRPTEGKVPAKVSVSYEYPTRYAMISGMTAAAMGGSSFEERASAAAGAGPAALVPLYVTKDNDLKLSRPARTGQVAAGWRLSAVGGMTAGDPASARNGTGDDLSTGERDFGLVGQDVYLQPSGWPGEAPVGQLRVSPTDVASARDGHLVVASGPHWAYPSNRHILMGIDPMTGVARRIAGDLSAVRKMATGPDDEIYAYNQTTSQKAVWLAGTGATASRRVAGGGSAVPTEGSLATSVSLPSVYDMAVDRSGNVYLATEDSRVWEVRPDGRMHTVAGGGASAPSDGAYATSVKFYPYSPTNIAACPDGSLLMSMFGGAVMRLGADGRLAFVAGGSSHTDADSPGTLAGRVATSTYLTVQDLYSDAQNRPCFLTTDHTYNWSPSWVYTVSGDGTLVRLAGAGPDNYSEREPDNALEAEFKASSVSVGADGVPYVGCTTYNSQAASIRRLAVPGESYDAAEATSHTLLDGAGAAYVFDGSGRHVSTTEVRSGVDLVKIDYDGQGRPRSVTDRFGRTTSLVTDERGSVCQVVGPDGHASSLEVDEAGQLRSVTGPDGATHSFTYASGSLLDQVTDPRGDHSHHAYNSTGRCTSMTDAAGNTTTFDAEMSGEGTRTTTVVQAEGDTLPSTWRSTGGKTVVSAVCAAGATTTVTSIGRDEVRDTSYTGGVTQSTRTLYDSVVGARYPVSTMTRMPSGRSFTITSDRDYADADKDGRNELQVTTTTVAGRSTVAIDDTARGIATLISPLGRKVISHYSTTTLLPQSIEASGLHSATFGYDTSGRPTRVAIGSRATTFSYDASGNLSGVTAPDGRAATFEHDATGRVTRVTRPDSSTVSYTYDAAGFATAITGGNDQTHTFEPTPTGARASWTLPGMASFTYRYDRQRRLVSATPPSGASVTQTWMRGLHTATSFSDGRIDYARPRCGRLDAVRRGSEVTSLAWDGWLTTREVRRGSISATIGYGYDGAGRVSGLSYAGATETLSYDGDGMLSFAGPFTISRSAQAGLPTEVSAAGFSLSRDISPYGEIDAATTTVGASTPFAYAVSRDAAGRITAKTETTAGGSVTLTYHYDAAGRLGSVWRNGALSESYGYDAAGNRVAERVPARGIEDTVTLTVDARDRVLTAGSDTYTFDVDGRMSAKHTGEGTTTYSYTGLSELSTVTLPSGRRVSYRYDGAGRRVARLVDGEVVTRYLFADATRLLATFDATGQLTARFSYADGRVPYSVTTPSGTYRLSFDQVGSLRTVTDASGDVVREISYDSFGCMTSDSNPGFEVPIGFAGGLADQDTGLVHFGAREYAPELGRFGSLDPIDFAGGDANLYGYCFGDPVNAVDPWGLWGGGHQITDSYVHGVLTVQWADSQGFTGGAANAIALASAKTDSIYPYNAVYNHIEAWNFGRWPDVLRPPASWGSEYYYAKSIEAARCGREAESLKLLGVAVHFEQDLAAHQPWWQHPDGIDIWEENSRTREMRLDDRRRATEAYTLAMLSHYRRDVGLK